MSQSLSVGITAGVGGSASVSSSIQNQMLIDINGDGLLDVVRKSPIQNNEDYSTYEVFYNTGSRIDTKSVSVLQIPKWKSLKLQSFSVNNNAINSNGMSYGGTAVSLKENATVDLSDVSSKIENLDCNVSVSANITGNLAVNVNVSIPWSFPVCFIKTNVTSNIGGGLYSGSTTTSATVKMIDLDGDGLLDHVLRIPGFGTFWKQNITGSYGLLKGIRLPQGGNIQLEYDKKYGTVDCPIFKYVMK